MDITSSLSQPTRAPGKIKRKSHRKSRNGCVRCKRRRIKVGFTQFSLRTTIKVHQCDETKPECTRCVDFGIVCDYNTTTSQQDSQQFERSKFRITQGPPLPKHRGRPRTIWGDEVPSNSLSLRNTQRFFPDNEDHLEDFKLLNHFITRPSDSPHATASDGGRDALHDQALLLSFAYPCILHLIQELSAWELARQQPSKQEHYRALAERHSTQGLQGATALLSQFNESNYHAAYTAATFACINCFARGPQPGEYLLFSASGSSQWLPLLHGIRTIIDLVGIEKIAAGPSGKASQKVATAKEPATAMLKCLDLDWIARFEQLHALVVSSPDSHANEDALHKLQWCYEATYGRDGVFKGDVNHQNAFIWPYQLGQDFVTRMQTQQPLSLIIAAHFALLLQNYEFTWYMVGWSDHIIGGISQLLDGDYRSWLDWPMEQARRIRSEKARNNAPSVVHLDVTDRAVLV